MHRAMGETNAVRARRTSMSRRTAAAASRIYRERFGSDDNSVPATFQVSALRILTVDILLSWAGSKKIIWVLPYIGVDKLCL